MVTTFTIKADIYFKEGVKELEMILKKTSDILLCKEETPVILILKNNERWTGLFGGIEEDEVILKGLTSGATMGIKLNYIENYFEPIEEK